MADLYGRSPRNRSPGLLRFDTSSDYINLVSLSPHRALRSSSRKGRHLQNGGRPRTCSLLTRKRERLRVRGMRLAILCLLASAALPSVSQAQVPVFKITPEDSSLASAFWGLVTPRIVKSPCTRRGNCRPHREASQRSSGGPEAIASQKTSRKASGRAYKEARSRCQ
jgi:hypothetical protein